MKPALGEQKQGAARSVKAKVVLPFISAGIILAGLVLAEMLLRHTFPDRVQHGEVAYEFHPDYLVKLKPNAEKVYVRAKGDGGDRIHWRTNRNGFRGDELVQEPGFRIMVYGDSNVQARFSRLEDTFSERLEDELTLQTGQPVECINAGVAGYGPDQSLLRFTEEVDTYRPNLVVFVVSALNDFGDLTRNRLFDLNPDGSLARRNDPPQADPRLTRGPFSKLLLLKVLGALVRGSRERSIDDYLALIKEEDEIYRGGENSEQESLLFADHYDYDVALFPNSEPAQQKVALMEAVLKEANKIATAKNIGFIVVIQPGPRDLTTRSNHNYEVFSQYPDYRPGNLSKLVAHGLERAGIGHVNLFDEYAKNDPEGLFFKVDAAHWNDAGQEFSAKRVAALVASRLAPSNEEALAGSS